MHSPVGFISSNSASVNNLQIKVDTLEKSNTKLTEEVGIASGRQVHRLRHKLIKIF